MLSGMTILISAGNVCFKVAKPVRLAPQGAPRMPWAPRRALPALKIPTIQIKVPQYLPNAGHAQTAL